MTKLESLLAELPSLPDRLMAGVSGGADSVALLRLLCLWKRQKPERQLWAVHVNHGLRGAASDGDEAFVRRLCEALSVPLLCYRGMAPEHAGEEWARELRYGFFAQAAAETGCSALCLAHHQNDQAETLLLHLLRGSGLTGLAGMRPVSERNGLILYRPLLEIPGAELKAALRELGQDWRTDASNEDTRYLRNALRQELLPAMEKLVPGSTEHIAHAARLLGDEEAALQAEAESILTKAAGPDWLRLSAMEALPEPMQRRVLRTWWQRNAGEDRDERSLSFSQSEELLRVLRGRPGDTCNLPGRMQTKRGWTCLHLVGTATPAPFGIRLTVIATCGNPGDGILEQELPESLYRACTLRTAKPGDWIVPFGKTRRRGLTEYLADQRVDGPFRDRIPLLCRDSEVLLVCGVGAGDLPAWNPEDHPIRICWTGEIPWQR